MKNILKWFSALALSAATALAAEPLRLQWGTIDTSSSAAQTESAALKARLAKKAALARARKTAVPEDRAAYIVQFPGPVTEEWRTWLESATQVRGYLPEFAYLVWATPTEMDTIAANPAVHWTGEWQAPYKTVRARSAAASADRLRDLADRHITVVHLDDLNDHVISYLLAKFTLVRVFYCRHIVLLYVVNCVPRHDIL